MKNSMAIKVFFLKEAIKVILPFFDLNEVRFESI